ncbi:hypothetical protein KAU11_12215 [Candidatus Babeliales bacterium]|nr:hypothetical protein [Candidatus Babeliales bacterium]
MIQKRTGVHLAVILCIILLSFLMIFYSNNKVDEDISSYEPSCTLNLTRDILEDSLARGTQFLLNNQKPEGNFNYEYDWVDQWMNPSDSEVRQAGPLWALWLIYNNDPDDSLIPAIKKGFSFFENNSIESEGGYKWIVYPDSTSGRTGTVALLTLSIVDFLRSAENIDVEFENNLESDLDKYLDFLISLRRENGQFYQSYNHETGIGYGGSSPYFDGESLLALTKAAKYLNKNDLKQTILESADVMYQVNVVDALESNPDSTTTKGFFQWGTMSFYELATSGWESTEKYSDIIIDLADWMIDVHRTLERTRNTAYAYEGIIHAYEISRICEDEFHIDKFKCTIDEGLYKLTSWQVGGPIQNEYLLNHPTTDILAIGGVMNHKEEPPLRIDVAQHQMHAVLLALRYVY